MNLAKDHYVRAILFEIQFFRHEEKSQSCAFAGVLFRISFSLDLMPV